MSSRVSKAAKRLQICIAVVLALVIGCVQPVLADGEYTIYDGGSSEEGEFHATTATSLSDYAPDTDPLVYCINENASRPETDETGISGYTKTAQATDSEINANISNSENAAYVRAVLYYGYPNLGGSDLWQTTYESDTGLDFPTSEDDLRINTQHAIWYYTDDYSGGTSDDTGYTLRTIAAANIDNVPEDFYVDLYTSSDVTSQNFIGLASADTSDSTTSDTTAEISVNVNKTWELTTGETYTGTKPEVTFTLYGGEGTTGTDYGTVTLGDDDTAVFENIDPGSYENFTIVENISGSIDGYTFEPCDNIVVSIDDLSSDNVLYAEAVNVVTSETVAASTDNIDTGDGSDMGLYLAVIIAEAVIAVSIRKLTAK